MNFATDMKSRCGEPTDGGNTASNPRVSGKIGLTVIPTNGLSDI
jgi:hypothetical protein